MTGMGAATGLMIAFQQVGWLVCGMFFWLIAIVLILSHIYDHRTKKTYDGTITGLRQRGDVSKGQGVFYPIITYGAGVDGAIEAETRHGSSSLATKIPGCAVRVMPDTHEPRMVTIRDGSGAGLIVLMFVMGLLPIGIGVSQYPVTLYTIFMFGVFGAWIGWKISRLIRPRAEWETRENFRRRKTDQLLKSRADLPRINRDDAIAKLQDMDGRFLKFSPLMTLIACVFISVGWWVAYDIGAMVRSSPSGAWVVILASLGVGVCVLMVMIRGVFRVLARRRRGYIFP